MKEGKSLTVVVLALSNCFVNEVCSNNCSSYIMLLLKEVMMDRRIDGYLSIYNLNLNLHTAIYNIGVDIVSIV